MNPYAHLVSEYARLLRKGRRLPLGSAQSARRPILPAGAPKVLIFSPHPDDECIVGGLALRLLRESHMEVINVAVTIGSKKSRRAERLRELKKACGYLDFGLVSVGLEKITFATRQKEKARWAKAVEVITTIIADSKPRVVFVPHEKDGHVTHIGTHHLVMDALKRQPKNFECFVVETEYWAAMDTPSLMVELSERDAGDLVTALSFHAGEVRRNPYHLLLPAWLQDNVRRGSELTGGRGAAAPGFAFATLYRLGRWNKGRWEVAFRDGKQLPCKRNPAGLLT